MEKIDLTKCNNLRYKAKIDGDDDHGRICVENADTGLAFLRSDREDCYVATWHCDCPSVEGYCGRKVTDFEIVPRDPETYQDWQVGDKISSDANVYTVIFRCGEVVLYKYEGEAGSRCCASPYTCEELFNAGFRLVLTDIEEQIIEEKKKYEPQDGDICFAETDTREQKFRIIYKGNSYSLADLHGTGWKLRKGASRAYSYIRPATDEEKQQLFDAMAKAGKRWNAEKKVVEDIPDLRAVKSEIKSEIKSDSTHEFKKGEPVLVRDRDMQAWRIAAFERLSGDSDYPYYVKCASGRLGYRYCIPYNERTMHLLGTTEDYKEEQS